MAYYEIPEFDGRVEGNRIIWEAFGEAVFIEPYGSDAIRVRASESLRIDVILNWTLLDVPTPEKVLFEQDKTCTKKFSGWMRQNRK